MSARICVESGAVCRSLHCATVCVLRLEREDAPPPAADASWSGAAQWLRDHYQDYATIAELCDAMIAAPPPAADAVSDAEMDAALAAYRRTYDVDGMTHYSALRRAIAAALAARGGR